MAEDTRTLDLCKQEPLHRSEPIPDLLIHVHVALPTADGSQAELAYARDAARLAGALWDALPGGTIDRLIVELMDRRASLFRVGFMSTDQILAATASWVPE